MAGPARLSVLSYNVLHDFGAARLLRPRGSGGVLPPWAKDRAKQAAKLVQQLQPDIACLQEVDDVAERALGDVLGETYVTAATMRNDSLPPKDGCSLLVRRDRWEVLEAHQFRMRDTVVKHFPAVEEIRSRAAGMTAAFWRELHEKLSMGVAARLQLADGSGRQLCVATTHLFWNPLYPDLKLLQAFFLARELEVFAAGCPLVLAGDLNSTPYTSTGSALSGVYALLTQGEVPVAHPDHPVVFRPSSGILTGISPSDVPALTVAPFKSAYREALGAEGPVTNAARDFRGCLDYVLYRDALEGARRSVLTLQGARALPTDAEVAARLPLPSSEHPSDHLPVMAEFELA